MAYRIAVCDDEKKEVEKLSNYLKNYAKENKVELSIETFLDGEELIRTYWQKKSPFDIILLDMEMKTVHGMDVAKEIRNIPDYNVIIAFVTSYPDFMQQGYDVQASQYLLKPMNYEVFREKLTYMLGLLKRYETQILTVKQQSGDILLNVPEIQYIETVKRTTGRGRLKFVLNEDCIDAAGSISEFEEKLKVQGFVRIHRAVIVNLRCIYKFQGDTVLLKSGITLPVGRKYAKEVRDCFSDFFVMQYRK